MGLEPGAFETPARHAPLDRRLPALPPLDAIRPHWPDDAQAYAVLEQERVIALTPAARLAGVRLDMRAGAAAIAPQVELLPRSPQAEADALQGAALALLQYTPEVALADEATVLLGVGASLQFFRGRAHWRAGSPPRCGRWTCGCRWAWRPPPPAPGAGAAPRTARLPAGADPAHARSQARRAAAGPAAPARPRLDWLQDIGCATLGDLRALPRAGLQRRSAPELLAALDAAYGLAPEPQRWIEPPARFARRIELMEYLEHTDAVLAVARRLAEQLGGWLAASQLAVRKITLSLEHERRRARPPTELELALSQPAWQPAQILGLLREKLGRMTLTDPVIAVALLAPETVAQPAASATLFPEPGGTAEDQRGCWTCSARGWAANACRARPQADHRPEAANAWGDALRPPAPSAAGAAGPSLLAAGSAAARAWPATARSIGARRCG